MPTFKSFADKSPAPLFDLHGPLARIDLSAWLTGLSYALGISLIGISTVAADLQRITILAATYAVFLLSVLLIQWHMRLALSAVTFGKPREFVQSGPFRLTRNPIYVAFLLPLASFAIYSPLAAAAAIAFYITAMNFTVIRQEERELAQTFGISFVYYKASVPRWII
jgi:protein-S-isoprenylcysteine O-methyltransferase Ste14